MADPVVDEEYLSQIEKARRVLRGLVATWNCAPIFQRLAWFDALDYDINTNTGGVNGSIRNSQRVQTDWCMKQGIQMFESLKMEYPRITYADLIQLGGVVAVEVTGGPTIDFVPGRKDLPSTEAQPSLFRPGRRVQVKYFDID
ncbi:heme peroxidase [Macleaya cordata]|uniref:Heme peroxidase n=1 Tax=Macleaya cordata TaxID=56857 RepID=A0A200PX80_MACCD|nr:heme peroxidase [Macleaya cordata]